MRRKIIILMMIVCLLMSQISFASPSSWAEDFMKSMLLEGLANEDMLDPDKLQQAITREEFAELTVRLYALATNEHMDDLVEWDPFADTDNKMVSKAFNIGIVSGTGTNNRGQRLFTPSKLVTRQEMAVMIVKELRVLGISVDPRYDKKFSDDAEIATWAYDAMAFAVEDAIFSGVGNNRVAPEAPATREQAMTIINKIAFKYGWIEDDQLESMFSYANASKIDEFWLPKDHELRAYTTSTGVKFRVSHLVDAYTVNIEGQQEALINILANSDISYDALKVLREKILSGYDLIGKTYNTQSLIYININTGQISNSPLQKPYMTFEVNNGIIVEYVK